MADRECRPVVLITGAASGIGAATAEAFADRGWIVYATDIEPFAPQVAATCRCLELDVTDGSAVQTVVDRIVDDTGRIDVLVNNAGISVPGPIEDVSLEDSRQLFDVVVHGPHRMTQAVLPTMRAQGEGRILMVSSVLGVAPSPGLGTYGAAKSALESMTDSLRMELRETAIAVSLIEPAWVDTGFAEAARSRMRQERTAVYSGLYETLESGWTLMCEPLAVSPERVAETILTAATAEQPSRRYPVGTRSRLILASRLLPDRLQDTLTTTLLGWSVPIRTHWPVGEPTGSAAESHQLSSGQTVAVPLETEATISGVVLTASAEVGQLLEGPLQPVRLTPNRSAVVILSVAYQRIGDTEIDPYNEVGIMIPAVPDSASSYPVVSGLSPAVGGYVWQLPVTTESACALGREIWGYPKSLAEIDISTTDGVTQTRLVVDGQRVLSLAVDQPPTRSLQLSTASYTTDNGEWYRTPLEFDGQLGMRPLSHRADWSLGSHRWAETLASLSLGSRPLARFGGSCTFRIGTPHTL